MSFNVLNRKVHYWVSVAAAPVLLVMIGSGLLLQMKKHWSWVQPSEVRGSGTTPVLDLEGILAAARSAEGLDVRGWDDVDRLDVRVRRGMVKVGLRNGYEVQVDLGTGKILQVAYRRSDLIESIHDGSIFGGNLTKLGLFLPAGIAMFVLWLGGLWMWWVPFIAKRRRRIARGARHGLTEARAPAEP